MHLSISLGLPVGRLDFGGGRLCLFFSRGAFATSEAREFVELCRIFLLERSHVTCPFVVIVVVVDVVVVVVVSAAVVVLVAT